MTSKRARPPHRRTAAKKKSATVRAVVVPQPIVVRFVDEQGNEWLIQVWRGKHGKRRRAMEYLSNPFDPRAPSVDVAALVKALKKGGVGAVLLSARAPVKPLPKPPSGGPSKPWRDTPATRNRSGGVKAAKRGGAKKAGKRAGSISHKGAGLASGRADPGTHGTGPRIGHKGRAE